jgi:hypothetical protein
MEECEAAEKARQAEAKRLEQESYDEIIAGLDERLGEAWSELIPYSKLVEKEYGIVIFEIDARELELVPFSLNASRNQIDFRSDLIDYANIDSVKILAHCLAIQRRGFAEWKRRQDGEAYHVQLEDEYRRACQAWRGEKEKIDEENWRRVAEAQAKVPSFYVYEFAFAIRTADEYEIEEPMLGRVDVISNKPDIDDFWGVVNNGKIERTQFFHPTYVSQEAREIRPLNNHDLCAQKSINGHTIFYGPGVEIEKYVPELLATPEIPEPPEGLHNADEIRWQEIGRHDPRNSDF